MESSAHSSRQENKLLEESCRAFGGRTFAEVPVGRGIYPSARRIDAVRFPSRARRELASYNPERFENQLSYAQQDGLELEVIEVTRWMEQRGVFGQVIVGAWLLEKEYGKVRTRR